ncbi:hypothetical protein QTP88_017115 [Uroleucon formosanum]
MRLPFAYDVMRRAHRNAIIFYGYSFQTPSPPLPPQRITLKPENCGEQRYHFTTPSASSSSFLLCHTVPIFQPYIIEGRKENEKSARQEGCETISSLAVTTTLMEKCVVSCTYSCATDVTYSEPYPPKSLLFVCRTGVCVDM